jgi:hypothetical protein
MTHHPAVPARLEASTIDTVLLRYGVFITPKRPAPSVTFVAFCAI